MKLIIHLFGMIVWCVTVFVSGVIIHLRHVINVKV